MTIVYWTVPNDFYITPAVNTDVQISSGSLCVTPSKKLTNGGCPEYNVYIKSITEARKVKEMKKNSLQSACDVGVFGHV